MIKYIEKEKRRRNLEIYCGEKKKQNLLKFP